MNPTMPMNNYPDDIRRYDRDPRSPFYDDPSARAAEEARDSVDPALCAQCERLGLALEVEAEVEMDEEGPYVHVEYAVDGHPLMEKDFAPVAARLARLDAEHPDLAEMVEEACQ